MLPNKKKMERNSFVSTVFSTYHKYTLYTHVVQKCQRKFDEKKLLEQDLSFKVFRMNIVVKFKHVRR